MKITTTKYDDVLDSGYRLEASYHTSSGAKALVFLKDLVQKSDQVLHINLLEELCVEGGIFIPSRFKRIFVKDIEHGAPYITGSSILDPEPLANSKYLSYKLTSNLEDLKFEDNMILVTCSGTIGRTMIVSEIFGSAVGSPDLLRVVADEQVIDPCYLYSFLSSQIGKSLITQKTYGGVVSHIESHHVLDLPVPRLRARIETKISQLIQKAKSLRTEANLLLKEARNMIEVEVGFSEIHPYEHKFTVGVSNLETSFSHRLDSFSYVGYVRDAMDALHTYDGEIISAESAGYRIYNPPIFKRMFAPSGHPYMSGVDLYNLKPETDRYLSRKQPNVEKYLVTKGMVLMQSAGQRYGLITTPLIVTRDLAGVAATSDIVRIEHDEIIENGYICALISSNFGRRLFLRYSYGTSIPRLNVPELSNIQIPWPKKNLRDKIGKMTLEAFDYRTEANRLENQAHSILYRTIGWNDDLN